jgi:hypothetical protein
VSSKRHNVILIDQLVCPGPAHIVTEILLLKFLHLIAFVYWLGGDLGTFFASRFVVREDLGPETRAIAMKIMLGCDQGPKSCMPLIFPLGLQLGQAMGLVSLHTAVLPSVWVIALGWFGIVQYLYFSNDLAARARVARFDFGLRLLTIVLIVGYAGALLADGGPAWFAWKMLVFAALVACGLLIRINLKPFVVAFGQLMNDGPSDAVNRALAKTLARVRPWVYLIWIGLLFNAAIGLHLI